MLNQLNIPMEPVLTMPAALAPILQQLQAIEPLYHAAYKDATPAQFEQLVAPNFWEVGATGRQYSRAFALAVLTQRPATPNENAWQTQDYHLIALSENTYLLTYTLLQPGRTTRRVTAWQHTSQGWQALYHQGTVVESTENKLQP